MWYGMDGATGLLIFNSLICDLADMIYMRLVNHFT